MSQLHGFWLAFYNIAIYACVLGSLSFVVLYGLFVRWWQTEEGRHLFSYSLAVADAFMLLGLRPIFGDFSWRPVLVLFCLTSLVAVIWWRLSLLIRRQWRNRPSQRGPERGPGEEKILG